MPDVFDPAKRRLIMQSVKRERTAPEELASSLFVAAGHTPVRQPEWLDGRPDLFFPEAGVVVFVHGCFWHGHDGCRKGRQKPKSNVEFWANKILKNRRRDARVARRLRGMGYHVYTIWECQLRRRVPPTRVVNALRRARPG